jgi:hypothetical protein
MASLRSSVFTFLDQNHILFPSSIGYGLYVYDIRAMPPIRARKQKLKGTHCFETSILGLGDEADCSIDLTCNSLATGGDAAVGSFFADPADRMISLRITNPVDTHVGWRQEHREMHVRAQLLLMWTKMHPAPPNACVVVPRTVWAPAATRMVVPRIDDDDVAYMCPSQSRFPGCGMRTASPPFLRNDGTIVVTVTDYHPARVFRSRRQNIFRRADTLPTEVEAEFGHKAVTTNVELPVQNGVYPRLRSKSLPLPKVRALFISSAYNPHISRLSISAHLTFIPRQKWS